ncbi:MAG: hypothetical protein DI534_07060 [Leifsonia xyli]|nr:MAG: hypothetical protein DI534_07060 [Leifsonia xyli]
MRSAPRSPLALLLAAVIVALPAAASASVGSVPPEVTAYATGGALVERLDAVYGVNAEGAGIAFDETTTTGTISRVFRWTDERLAGDTSGKPTRMANEWALPVSVAEKPVGVAIIWINLDTEQPELAEFEPDAAAATALAAVPADAQLVRDLGSDAWFALAGDTLTPLVAGTSGLTGPVPVADYRVVSPTPSPAPETSDAGFGVAVGVAVLLFVIILAALFLLPRMRRPRDEPAAPATVAAVPTEVVEERPAKPDASRDPAPTPAPKPAPTAQPAPTAKSAAPAPKPNPTAKRPASSSRKPDPTPAAPAKPAAKPAPKPRAKPAAKPAATSTAAASTAAVKSTPKLRAKPAPKPAPAPTEVVEERPAKPDASRDPAPTAKRTASSSPKPTPQPRTPQPRTPQPRAPRQRPPKPPAEV